MSECKEMQIDESEALNSIYEGDPNFKANNATSYQYKYGEDDDSKSFLIEIIWTDQYPNELPQFNMDTFFNRHLVPSVKEKIKNALLDEAEQWLGCGMTYTLFECIKDKIDDLTAEQLNNPISNSQPVDLSSTVEALKISATESSAKTEKKEQLTKSQKRKQWEKSDHKGEKPRGWNWVDIVKHLSQTGGGYTKEKDTSSVVNTSSLPLPVNTNV